ncbi:MAG: OsmC family peroxiredoxin [Promethearchaeota archaeon]|nr:MAG: OsmC family peroxiredoxin [Candidatus Lokiarchaeota archaeon]
MNFDKFNSVLKQLADRVEERVTGTRLAKNPILNRIDLKGFKSVVNQYIQDRNLCKKALNVHGIWRLDLDYGPQFETRLDTERAGAITIQTDDLTIFGGGGTALHPITLCMAGFCGCYSAAFAKWAAMEGIELDQLQIRVKGDLDFSSILGIKDDVPIVDNYMIEMFIESKASAEEIDRISQITKKRCFCSYCIMTSIIAKLILNNKISVNLSNGYDRGDSEEQILEKIKEINRINLEKLQDTIEVFTQNPELCKRVIEAKGDWRLNVEYGPQFEIQLQTEKAGEITIQTDETIILGGGGTSFHPVALCIAGFCASISSTFIKTASFKGIKLTRFEIKAKMDIDLTTGFGIEDGIPMIDGFNVELIVESNSDTETLQSILEETKKRDFCYYCYSTPIFPEIIINKLEKAKKSSPKKASSVLHKGMVKPIEFLQLGRPHNIKERTRELRIKTL